MKVDHDYFVWGRTDSKNVFSVFENVDRDFKFIQTKANSLVFYVKVFTVFVFTVFVFTADAWGSGRRCGR